MKVRTVKRGFFPNYRRIQLATILMAIKELGISRSDKGVIYDLAWKNDGTILEKLISGEAIYDT